MDINIETAKELNFDRDGVNHRVSLLSVTIDGIHCDVKYNHTTRMYFNLDWAEVTPEQAKVVKQAVLDYVTPKDRTA